MCNCNLITTDISFIIHKRITSSGNVKGRGWCLGWTCMYYDTEVQFARLTLNSPSRYVRATNFSTSSMRMTGKESFNTMIHCSVFRWVSLKIICGRDERLRYCCRSSSEPSPQLCLGNFSETYGQWVHVDDHEVKGHGEGHGAHQPAVAPGGHAQKRLVLRQAGGGGKDGEGGGICRSRLKLGECWKVWKWWMLWAPIMRNLN